MKKTTEKRCRIHNWPEYNQSLVSRGSLKLWLDAKVIDGWYESEPNGLPGADKTYSDATILAMLTIRQVFSLGLRQTIGFVASTFEILGLELKVPCYSTLSRRASKLPVALLCKPREDAHLAIDSTGLKLYGQGEWCVRAHGASKRRTWRKMHVCIDVESGEIVAVETTENNVGDSEAVGGLHEQVDGTIRQVSADGAYDTFEVHDKIAERSASAAIPSRRTAKVRKHGNSQGPRHPRDETIRAIRRQGRAEWKRSSGYHKRSLIENAIGRFKGIFGAKLDARLIENQLVEVALKCRALNVMFKLGRPDSEMVPI